MGLELPMLIDPEDSDLRELTTLERPSPLTRRTLSQTMLSVVKSREETKLSTNPPTYRDSSLRRESAERLSERLTSWPSINFPRNRFKNTRKSLTSTPKSKRLPRK